MAKATTDTKKNPAPVEQTEQAPPEQAPLSFLGSIIDERTNEKKAFADGEKAKREALFKLADVMIDRITGDGQEYTAFLNMQSQVSFLGVNNTALVLAQRPTASNLHTYKEWKDRGVRVTDYDNPVQLLMTGKFSGTKTVETTNAYGDIEAKNVNYSGHGTNIVHFYDTLQTDNPNWLEKPVPDSQEKKQIAIKAMLQNAKVSVAINNDLAQPSYDPARRQISLSENLTPEETFRQLAVGCAHANMQKNRLDYDPGQYTLEAYSVAHVMCKRFGVEHAEMDFSGAPQWFAALNEYSEKATKDSLYLVNSVSKEMGNAVHKDLSPPSQQRSGQRRSNPSQTR